MTTVFREPPSSALDEVRMGCLPRYVLAVVYLIAGQKHEAWYQFQTGIDRMRNTGDYAPGGQFDHMYPGWRNCDLTHRQVVWNRRISQARTVSEAGIDGVDK